MNEPIKSRDDFPALLNSRGLLGAAVEIGTNRGIFAAHLRKEWRGRVLYCVDPWEHGGYANQSKAERVAARMECAERLEGLPGLSIMLPFGSVAIATEFAAALPSGAPNGFDFVYIDGDHSYEAVSEDLRAWWPLVRSGGILAGHDWIPDGWRRYGDGPDAASSTPSAISESWPCFVRAAVYNFFGGLPGYFGGLNYTSRECDGGWRSWYTVKP